MKQIFLLFLTGLFCLILNAQTRPNDAYFAEESGYFINIKPALNGYVFTDNYCNALYYLENGELSKLISALGCGRYFSVSPDRTKIGFKLISKSGQTPAYILLEDKSLHCIAEESQMCGQVGFTDNWVYYTKDEWLYLLSNDDSILRVKLGNYSNLVAVSNNHEQCAFSSENDELILLTLEGFSKTVISESGKMSVYPQFSPDGKKILYQSNEMYVFEIATGITYNVGNGIGPKWSPDSENIVFTKSLTDDSALFSSDIYIGNYKTGTHQKITDTPAIHEMQPFFITENEIIYNTYIARGIYKLNISNNTTELIYQHEEELEISFFELTKAKSEYVVPGIIPYTHQVYDTPDDHYGYGSCAPACAIMAISYYNRLPPWPVNITKLYPHTSLYGAYVSSRYRLNEHYFTESAQPSGGGSLAYGGYGYMWGLGSPNSQMRNYMQLHYMESSQLWNNSVTWASVIAEIDADYPLSVCAMLTNSGHLILAKGYIHNQRTLIFSEPYGDKNTPSWPSYDGQKAYYDWPGYNNGYQNLDYNGTYGVIAWTVTAHTSEVVYNDSIIDDVYYNHGFNVNNSQDGSHQRYFRDVNGGYNGHFWYTITEASANDIAWVEWIPTLANEGYYNISAYIPATYADAENAPYNITDADGLHVVTIDQGDYADEWVDLGNYRFEFNGELKVRLGDGTGIVGQNIAFDAIKFSFMPSPVADFTTSSQDFCIGDSVYFINESINAQSYEWTLPGASITSSIDENIAVIYSMAGTYDVGLSVSGILETYTLNIENYITIHKAPIAEFTFSPDVVYLPNAVVLFSNLSTNANTYFWDFGDETSSTDINPYHEYNVSGNYIVSLTAGNAYCDDDVFVYGSDVIVLNPTDINDTNTEIITFYPNPAKNTINLVCEEEIASVKILDATGRILYHGKSVDNKIDISNLLPGNYIIELTAKNAIYIRKFIK